MSELWSLRTLDGTIEKKTFFFTTNNENEIGNRPLETSECIFKVLHCEVETQNQKDKNQTLKLSNYLSSWVSNSENQNQPSTIKCKIGLNSITAVDRLIEMGITRMRKNENATFLLKSEKENQSFHIQIQIQLETFEDVEELHEMEAGKLINLATQLKSEGVNLFSQRRTEDAFHKFSKALKYLIVIDEKTLAEDLKLSKNNLMLTLRNNLSGCHFLSEFKNWRLVIQLSDQVLDSDKENVKALYRRGVAYLEIEEYEKSRIDLLKAKELDPNNRAIDSKLDDLKKKQIESNGRYKSVMKKMFV